METNLFAQITEPKYVIDQYAVNDITTNVEHESAFIHPSSLAKQNSNYLLEAKYIISMNNIEKKTDNSLLKASYIAYEITTIRSFDGEAHSVWKRYKELYNWYYNVRIIMLVECFRCVTA